MTTDREPHLHRVLHELAGRLEGARDDDAAIRPVLRAARVFLDADSACLAVPDPESPGASVILSLGDHVTWDRALLAAFLRDERPRVPFDRLLYPVVRRGRRWGAVGLAKKAGEFPRGSGRVLQAFAEDLGRYLARIDTVRVNDLRARIERKVMEQLRPRDLFYHVLDALRGVTRYDHSSALLMTADSGATLELAAEQMAWLKGPSRRIGLKLQVRDALREFLRRGEAHGFSREGDDWVPWKARDGPELAELLDYNRLDAEGGGIPRESTILAAPLATRDGLIGVLKVAARSRHLLQEWELGLLGQFAPPASVAIQVLLGMDSLRARIIDAERKHAVADIARGVAHDVNNALGAVLPLVQQLQVDAREGTLSPELLEADLRQIEESVLVCRRIFGGMLAFARGADRRVGQGNFRRAVDATLAILRRSLERLGIDVDVRIADALPPVRCGQGDLEQLVLNLVTNARDAMPGGGRLVIAAAARDGEVEVVIEDEGTGIAPEILDRIHEPFFTTKPDGNGLGLSICRSIMWDMHASLRIDSALDRGTRVTLRLPPAQTEAPAEAR